jgi:hypothetical protein
MLNSGEHCNLLSTKSVLEIQKAEWSCALQMNSVKMKSPKAERKQAYPMIGTMKMVKKTGGL